MNTCTLFYFDCGICDPRPITRTRAAYILMAARSRRRGNVTRHTLFNGKRCWQIGDTLTTLQTR